MADCPMAVAIIEQVDRQTKDYKHSKNVLKIMYAITSTKKNTFN